MAKYPWLILSFFVGGFCFFQMQNSIQQRSALMRAANIELASSIQTTVGAVQKNIIPLLLDKALAQNLVWKLHHSIGSVLEARKLTGIIQDLALWSADCRLISQSGLRAARQACPLESLESKVLGELKDHKGTTPLWYEAWKSEGTDLVLQTITLLPLVGEPIYLVVHSALDSFWFVQFPRLVEALSSAQGEIHGAPNVDEANPAPLRPVVRFGRGTWGWVEEMFRPVGGFNLERTKRFLEKLAWISWGLGLLLLTVWIRSLKASLSDSNRQISELLLGSQMLVKTNLLEISQKEAAIDEGSLKTILSDQTTIINRCREFWNQTIKAAHYEIEEHKQKIAGLERTIQQQEFDLDSFKETMRKLAEMESLDWQYSWFMRPYRAKLESLMDSLEDLMATLKTFEQSTHQQCLHLKDWTVQIAIKGSRKFMRSLAETQGSKDGTTALDDQIASLVAKADSQQQLTQVCLLLGSQLLGEWERSLKVVSHWESLVGRRMATINNKAASPVEPLNLSTANLLDWVREAQEMVLWSLDQTGERECFINKIPIGSETVDPDGHSVGYSDGNPQQMATLWTSALLQLYSSLLEQEPLPKVYTTLRDHGPRRNLIIYALSGDHRATVSQPSEITSYGATLRIVQGLLYDWGISCSVLSQLHGRMGYSLSWTHIHTGSELLNPLAKKRANYVE